MIYLSIGSSTLTYGLRFERLFPVIYDYEGDAIIPQIYVPELPKLAFWISPYAEDESLNVVLSDNLIEGVNCEEGEYEELTISFIDGSTGQSTTYSWRMTILSRAEYALGVEQGTIFDQSDLNEAIFSEDAIGFLETQKEIASSARKEAAEAACQAS